MVNEMVGKLDIVLKPNAMKTVALWSLIEASHIDVEAIILTIWKLVINIIAHLI
jgi:hypothetical protein